MSGKALVYKKEQWLNNGLQNRLPACCQAMFDNNSSREIEGCLPTSCDAAAKLQNTNGTALNALVSAVKMIWHGVTM